MCPRKSDIFSVTTPEEANAHATFVIAYLHRTPSMSAKLPKMVMNRVDALTEYWKKVRK